MKLKLKDLMYTTCAELRRTSLDSVGYSEFIHHTSKCNVYWEVERLVGTGMPGGPGRPIIAIQQIREGKL